MVKFWIQLEIGFLAYLFERKFRFCSSVQVRAELTSLFSSTLVWNYNLLNYMFRHSRGCICFVKILPGFIVTRKSMKSYFWHHYSSPLCHYLDRICNRKWWKKSQLPCRNVTKQQNSALINQTHILTARLMILNCRV